MKCILQPRCPLNQQDLQANSTNLRKYTGSDEVSLLRRFMNHSCEAVKEMSFHSLSASPKAKSLPFKERLLRQFTGD